MRLIVIGAVAAGTSAAAKASRAANSGGKPEIVIYEKGTDISYAGCGMPYYLGGVFDDVNQIASRNPAFFKKKYGIDILLSHEVVSINAAEKSVVIKDLLSGAEFTDSYDALIIATGAKASVPPIKGANLPHVFVLRNLSDMRKIKAYMDEKKPQTAAIIGTGAVGLEVCESFVAKGLKVTMIEKLPQVTPGLDSDMAALVQAELEKHGVPAIVGASVQEITGTGIVLGEGKVVEADIVLLSTGVKPETELAGRAGIELGVAGAIKVDKFMCTSVAGVYACGDCAEQFQVTTGKPVYRPLGSTANKMGRVAGENAAGGNAEFKGILGTGIFRIFDLTVAVTGLSEREANEQGYEAVAIRDKKPNRPEYMKAGEINIKAVADKASGKLLGAQIVGGEGVDKRIDVFVTAITLGATAEDLINLDLAYSPPYSTVRDPITYAGMILDNVINGTVE